MKSATPFFRLEGALETSNDPRERLYWQEGQADRTVDRLALRLELAVNSILLDRHTRLVFYGWHNRPDDIEEEHPYSRVPTTLLNLLPLPPIGRQFGMYHTSGHSAEILSSFGYTNMGRAYVKQFHNMRTLLDGQRGPNVLVMSGTSYLPHSTRWHFGRPEGIIKRVAIDGTDPKSDDTPMARALKDQHCQFSFTPVFDDDQRPIRVSGVTDKKSALIRMAAVLLRDHSQNGGVLGSALSRIEKLAAQTANDPDRQYDWQDRARLLLLVNSYDQCEWTAKALQDHWPAEQGHIFYLVREDSAEANDLLMAGQLGRIDIEQFAQTNGRILVAPLDAIGRGFNILNRHYKAAFGAVFFLTRPMPHPHDIPAIAQELNRRMEDWLSDETFAAWQQGDGIYQRGVELRRLASLYWRSVENRSYYSRLRDEIDKRDWGENEVRFGANPRRDLAATTAGKIVQAIGRLLRGDVPFHAYFVDAAWAPQQAKRLAGDDNEQLDTPRTSLLCAMIDVLGDYVAEDLIGRELYGLIHNKLEMTEHFDW